jgi:hypothetical protein
VGYTVDTHIMSSRGAKGIRLPLTIGYLACKISARILQSEKPADYSDTEFGLIINLTKAKARSRNLTRGARACRT